MKYTLLHPCASEQMLAKFCDDIWQHQAPMSSNIQNHYSDVIMGSKASQITSLTTVYSSVYSDTDQRKHQSSASLAFVQGIHHGLVNSPHKWPVTRKMLPFDDVIMIGAWHFLLEQLWQGLMLQAIHYLLNQCWQSPVTPYGITRPQWVRTSITLEQLRHALPLIQCKSAWVNKNSIDCLGAISRRV